MHYLNMRHTHEHSTVWAYYVNPKGNNPHRHHVISTKKFKFPTFATFINVTQLLTAMLIDLKHILTLCLSS